MSEHLDKNCNNHYAYYHLLLLNRHRAGHLSPPDALAEAVQRALHALLRRMMEGIAVQHPLTDTQLEELEYLAGVDARAATGAASLQRSGSGGPPTSGEMKGIVTQVAAAWAERLEQDAVWPPENLCQSCLPLGISRSEAPFRQRFTHHLF